MPASLIAFVAWRRLELIDENVLNTATATKFGDFSLNLSGKTMVSHGNHFFKTHF